MATVLQVAIHIRRFQTRRDSVIVCAMEEIDIEGKKYISTKQASEMTGYAKDYVGQLCREGRVPARQIGRSWYVLATAIKEHRFGVADAIKEEIPKTEVAVHKVGEVKKESAVEAWDKPHYEPEEPKYFPSLNKLTYKPIEPCVKDEVVESESTDTDKESAGAMDAMQQVWKEWFAHKENEESEVAIPTHKESATDKKPEIELEEEAHVPIRAVYSPEKQAHLPDNAPRAVVANREAMSARIGTEVALITRVLQAIFLMVALVSIILGALGTGLADKYISSNQVIEKLTGTTNL